MEKKPILDGRQQVLSDIAHSAAEGGQHFFYILIREPLGPLEREEKYAEPTSFAPPA